jgi:hypothetical protein
MIDFDQSEKLKVGNKVSIVDANDSRWIRCEGTVRKVNRESSCVTLEGVDIFGSDGNKKDRFVAHHDEYSVHSLNNLKISVIHGDDMGKIAETPFNVDEIYIPPQSIIIIVLFIYFFILFIVG